MRDFKGMKRQRNRGRGGGGGGGKPQQHNANRAFDSNGPDNVKVRGAAQHIFEKYSQLARDAGSAGDRVLAENYLQHAEHYFRVLRAMQPQRPVSEIMGRDNFVSGYDIDFEDEGQNGEETAEAEADGAADGRRDDRQWQRDERPQDRQQGEYRQRDDRPRDDRPREDRQPRDDYRPRDDRQQGEYRQRDDRPREDRPREDRPREDRPREDRQQGEFRPRDDRDRQAQGQGRYPREDRQQGRYQGDRQGRQDRDFRNDRPERDPLSVIEPQATPLTATPSAPAPAYEPHESSVLRGEDGATSHAPAFLQPRAEPRPESEDEPVEARRPRRRRAPRTFEPGQPAPAEVEEG
jgi:Domain of unknown function (DUF4167)